MNTFKSTELNELFSAMAKAQAEIKCATRESNNPFYKTKYANLQSLIEASRPALCQNGLSVIQQVVSDENGQDCLSTMLCHSSGQWIQSRMKINPSKPDVQALGSYITYLRRYLYGALIGVYDGEDDDGNSHSENNGYAQQKTPTNLLISDDQRDILERELLDHKDVKTSLFKMLGITELRNMERDMFHDMLKKVREIIANKMSAKS